MLSGRLSEEMEVKVAASEAWKVYGTLQLAHIAADKLPHILQKFDILEGDGGLGTLLLLTFPPGMPGPSYQKEKFVVVDDEKRVKVAEVVEGGHLAVGFTQYKVRFEVLEKEENSCITKVSVEYEIGEDGEDKVAFATAKPFVDIMKAAADFLTISNAD